MADVGDLVTLQLTVAEGDATTTATVTVTRPVSGDQITPAASTADTGVTWTAQITLDEPGAWLVEWSVTGAGAGVEVDRVYAVQLDGVGYATLSDLTGWLGAEPPAGSARLLIRARELLDDLLIGAVYDVDDDDLPTAAAVIAALRDASCAQVEYWQEIGDATGAAASTAYDTVRIGSVTLSRRAGRSGDEQRQTQVYAPAAVRILRTAGLLPIRPLIRG